MTKSVQDKTKQIEEVGFMVMTQGLSNEELMKSLMKLHRTGGRMVEVESDHMFWLVPEDSVNNLNMNGRSLN